MPPPTNTTPATATAVLVSALPLVTTQEVSDGVDAVTVYFKLTNDLAHDSVIMFWFHGDIPVGGFSYVPDYTIYAEVGLSNVVSSAIANCETQISIKAGASYWIKVDSVGASPLVTATLNINISAKPYSTEYPAGQILIFCPNAPNYFIDQGGIFAGFIDPVTGDIENFIPFFPTCEYGDQLRSSGVFLITDNNNVTGTPPGTPPGSNEWYLLFYNKDFTQLNQITKTGGNGFEPIIRSNQTENKFWVVSPGYGAPNTYAYVNSSGVMSAEFDLDDFPVEGDVNASAIAGTNDDAYLLVAPDLTSGNNYIYRWNLNTHAWDGTIGSPIASYRPVDMLVMDDDTVVVLYHNTSNDTDVKLLHYDLDGTLLLDYGITEAKASSFFPRLGYAIDPLYFWMWSPYTDGSTKIRKIKLSDGTLAINSETRNVYDSQIEQASPALIYVSDSCPIIEMMLDGGEAPPDPPIEGGLYFISTRDRNVPITDDSVLKHDVYYETTKKIPDPTIRTALLGD